MSENQNYAGERLDPLVKIHLIKEEKYEEAAQLRDYMIFNKIKRK